jgi:hypothetical protein
MNAEHVMNPVGQNNGEIRMPRRGKDKFAFGDDPGFEIDTIDTWDEFVEFDKSTRDEKGELPKGQLVAYNQAKRAFFQNVIKRGYERSPELAGKPVPVLTLAEVCVFLAQLEGKVKELQRFFVLSSPALPSSPPNTDNRFYQ